MINGNLVRALVACWFVTMAGLTLTGCAIMKRVYVSTYDTVFGDVSESNSVSQQADTGK